MLARRLGITTLLAALFGLWSDSAAQTLEIRPDRAQATIGDPITLRITVRLPPGMALIDAVPHPLVAPPRGIRILSADSLRPRGDGTLTGTARVAFYRIGQQPVPTLALLYRAAPGDPPDTLVHMPVSVEITPTLEPGNPRLRDIKPLLQIGGPVWGPLAVLLATIAAGFWWLRRKARLGTVTEQRSGMPVELGPFDLALHRLSELEAAARMSGNGIVPLYADVSEVVRECLRQIGAIPHCGLTTSEVGRALPAALSGQELGLRCEELLGDADLVKFARVRPDFAAAEIQLARARELLTRWRQALASRSDDAVR